MRVLRDRQDCVGAAARPSCPPTTQHRSIDLEDVGKLWAEWGIHGLMLVSFVLQVFLFFAAGLRKRSTSRILRSLLWLAYLSADSVAIFVLGHLSVHASAPRHQLLFFWAPFVLLHLGGQHTITAFSMQDNELWRRHLLGLVTQVAVAGYVVSRSSWSDKRLLAAMVLMFLSGCLRYAERTLCLYNASPSKHRESSLDQLRFFKYMPKTGVTGTFIDDDITEVLNDDGKRPPFHEYYNISLNAVTLASDTPLGDINTSEISKHLQVLRVNTNRYRTYNYVGTRLSLIYELLYTKGPLRHYFLQKLRLSFFKLCDRCPFFTLCHRCPMSCSTLSLLIDLSFLLVFVLSPLLSTIAAMALFVIAKKSQLYSQADVMVSYVLIIGAITLEVASLFITFVLGQQVPRAVRNAVWSIAKYIYPAWGTKQWSEMLGQYNMVNSLTKHHVACINSFVPGWIRKHLDDKTVTHIHIYEDLKKFVLDKMLELGTRQDCNFASFRGQLALRDRKGILSPAGFETLYKSIDDVHLATTVLIWHMATDMLFFQDNGTTDNTNSYHQMKKMTRELSNYIMYLIFKCGVMFIDTAEIEHENTHWGMKREGLGEIGAMKRVFQLQTSTSVNVVYPLFSHACKVAQELINIVPGEAESWDLVAAVWVEMLFYIAPRCGGAFHSKHLATDGEFITHVLFLM